MRLGALDEVMERFGARARRGDDLTAQALQLVTIVREMIDEGAIASGRSACAGCPVPTPHVVRRTLDALCPDGRAIALGLFDHDGLWTSFVARRRGGGLRRHRGARRAAAGARAPLGRLAARLPAPRARGRGSLRAARLRVLRRRDALPRAACCQALGTLAALQVRLPPAQLEATSTTVTDGTTDAGILPLVVGILFGTAAVIAASALAWDAYVQGQAQAQVAVIDANTRAAAMLRDKEIHDRELVRNERAQTATASMASLMALLTEHASEQTSAGRSAADPFSDVRARTADQLLATHKKLVDELANEAPLTPVAYPKVGGDVPKPSPSKGFFGDMMEAIFKPENIAAAGVVIGGYKLLSNLEKPPRDRR